MTTKYIRTTHLIAYFAVLLALCVFALGLGEV
jgi:hypothetical protein